MTSILKDVTQNRLSSANKVQVGKPVAAKPLVIPTSLACNVTAPAKPLGRRVRRNDPYNWEWRMPVEQTFAVCSPMAMQPTAMETMMATPQVQSHSMSITLPDTTTVAPSADGQPDVCRALVQFKCHHGEFTAGFELRKGQYVVVQGDRGHDVGVVIRINTDECQQYVERTGPTGSVMRYATQREVDYWASDLKADEATALEYCRQRVAKHRLQMEVRHAEYQFDKKKLTFYYEAKSRVDFVTLLKELFREFSCRIWMEKIRSHE